MALFWRLSCSRRGDSSFGKEPSALEITLLVWLCFQYCCLVLKLFSRTSLHSGDQRESLWSRLTVFSQVSNLVLGSEYKQQQSILKTQGALGASPQFSPGQLSRYLRLHGIPCSIQNSSEVLTFLLWPKALPLHTECSSWLACENGVICITSYPLNPACWVDSSFQAHFLLLEGEFLEELCLYSFSFAWCFFCYFNTPEIREELCTFEPASVLPRGNGWQTPIESLLNCLHTPTRRGPG